MTYSIGEVESLIGVKQAVIRYWQEHIPGFAAQKDTYGRRVFTTKDISLLSRLKYLVYQKKFTLEGAKKQLLCDMGMIEEVKDVLQDIQGLRLTLLNIYFSVHNRA